MVVSMDSNLVMWNSRRQDAVFPFQNTYIACSEITKDLQWLQQLYKNYSGARLSRLHTLLTDNEAALKLCEIQTFFHRRTRRIEHRYHYVQQVDRPESSDNEGDNRKGKPSRYLIPMSEMAGTMDDWLNLVDWDMVFGAGGEC